MKALGADDPRVIGEYRLRARLGAGGMGRVYLGLSPGGRAVAIKVVHPELAEDADFLRRFAQEVAAARAVSGIYTAPVVASGLDERPPWLATAFVPAPSLDQVIAEHGPMPEAALWPLFAGLTEALQAIHDCGVVHRDLKPANVLLAADGPRVIDFGISRATDGTVLTETGTVFGTPGFMSPEQAEGSGAGPASDVFALGCVLAYASCGSGPFGTGTAAAVLYRVVHLEPMLDRVPQQLREPVAACLAKDPAARPSLRTLAGIIARSGPQGTGPSAVAFWPPPVADVLSAYQARLEADTKTAPPASASAAVSAASVASGHPSTRSAASPPPRGYGSTYSMPPAGGPRGYLPGRSGAGAGSGSGSGGGFQFPPAAPAYPAYPAGTRGPVYQLPASMVTAVRLMYAGAAYTLVYAIGLLVVAASIARRHPIAAAMSSGQIKPAGWAVLIALMLAEVALWLGIAHACQNGRNGARITGTVLFGLHTLGALAVIGSKHPGIGLTKLLTVIGWLIALGAVIFLWKRTSSAFFRVAASQ